MSKNKQSMAYIGLGSNMAKPLKQLCDALQAISLLPSCELREVSSFYTSKPMGPQDQPDYVNAVAKVETELSPLDLLHALQNIELQQGRERKGQRWGPRTLDLDILLFGQQVIQHAELIVPHYGLKQRAFVLVPLAEIALDLVLPCGVKIDDLLKNCDDAASLVKLKLDSARHCQKPDNAKKLA